MENSIAILYTTFLRDNLMYETLNSIIQHNPNNYLILVADQGEYSEEKISFIKKIYNCNYYLLPYDCGLSYARNFLVQKASEFHIPYCILTADSILFTEHCNFVNIINFMKTDPKIAKVGLKLNNRVAWEFNLDLIKGDSFILQVSKDYITHNQTPYHKVDICKNFFLATTESLLAVPWDNELKLLEHEDHCWRLKQAGYKTFTVDTYSAEYISSKNAKYNEMRKRMYDEYNLKLRQKYGITSWIKYGEGVIDEIRKDK
jgi:GT2 family glycosyltransferase